MVKKYAELYLDARRALLPTEGQFASNVARELICAASGKTAEQLISDRDLYASEEICELAQSFVRRRVAGEPMPYILGEWDFYGMTLTVTPDVLIPRDDTMAVTELAIKKALFLEQNPRILDLCTGSGCIGLAIARRVKDARVTLGDVSPAALRVARQNVGSQRLSGRVKCLTIDVRQPAAPFLGTFDLIVSNPPYVTTAEMETLDPSVRDYEPHLALWGGDDGLDFYRAIVRNFTPALNPGGWLCFEFGMGQDAAVCDLLRRAGYEIAELKKRHRRHHPGRSRPEERGRLTMAQKKPAYEAPAPADDKKKALETALHQIEKNYGKGAVMRLGDRPEMNVDAIPTGSLALDAALGIGGLPRGRIVEIYGPESSGKTTLALHVLAEAQKRGGEVAFVDAEHALDPVYAAAIGVDIDSMLVSQPDTGEQALDITDALVRSGAIDVVVVDSVAALTPRAEIEGEMGEAFVGLQARLMSQALRKLAGTVSKTNCIVIFINQLRMKIGVMYGNPETTTGGNALKFYSSVRLDVRKIEAIKSGTEIVGNRTRVKVIKNKCAPPFREAVFDIMYGEGISRFGELLDIAVTLELVNKSGSWFSVGDERIGQGRDNAKQYIADHPELAAELEARVRAHLMEVQNSRIKQPAAPAKPVDVSADDFDAE